MSSPERIYRGSVRLFSLVFAALGLAILNQHPRKRRRAALGGVLLGVAFLAVGVGRLWIASRT